MFIHTSVLRFAVRSDNDNPNDDPNHKSKDESNDEPAVCQGMVISNK